MDPLLLLLGAGLLLLRRKRARVRLPAGAGEQVCYPLQVAGSAVDADGLEPAAMAFYHRVACAWGQPLTMTSGRRSYVAQADAMARKVSRGENLRQLYRDREQIDALLELPVGDWPGELRRWAEAGRPLSSHLGGRAFDLRSRDMTDGQLQKLSALVGQLGGRAVVESDHIHVEIPRS